VSGLRLGVFSQYSQWQPIVREVEFQTDDGTWRKNVDGCSDPSVSIVSGGGA